MYSEETSSSSALRGAAAGVIGGIVGSGAMVLFNHALARVGFGEHDRGRHHQQRRNDAKPNDSDGTIADEPASRKAASRVVEAATGRPLTEPEKDVAGSLFHYGFGAIVGGLYGALAARQPRITAGAGIPYGAAVFAAAGEVGIPMFGLSRRPTEYPPERHLAALATHLVFGLTLETVRTLLMRHSHAEPYDLSSLGV